MTGFFFPPVSLGPSDNSCTFQANSSKSHDTEEESEN